MTDYDALNKVVRQFKSKLTRLQNKHDHAGVVALWDEFRTWCESPAGMYPDNWRRWSVAAEDAQRALDRAQWEWSPPTS